MCNALLFHQLRLFLLLAHVSFLHLHCMSEESSDLRNRVHECSSFLPLFLDEAALVLYYCTCVTWLQYQTLVSSFFLSFFLSFFFLIFLGVKLAFGFMLLVFCINIINLVWFGGICNCPFLCFALIFANKNWYFWKINNRIETLILLTSYIGHILAVLYANIYRYKLV